MFSKLAGKNVKRSMKDYMVYFVTLMLAICIFYMFNSVDDQLVMLKLRAQGSTGATMVGLVVRLLSIVITFVLAFLIVYANDFIMRRRKREFGIYMVLGVSNQRISRMLAIETLLIGLLALGVGLVCGYFASQGMSIMTASLFKVSITDYHFIFSLEAMLQTCFFFALIFALVMLFNMRTVRKFTLAQLLQSSKENQQLSTRWQKAPIVTIILGVLVIILSYWIVLFFGMQLFSYTLLPGIVVNFGGTLLLLYGLAGLLLSGKSQGRKYYRGLNMFAQRQLASRVNTNAVSMAFICSMLFLTLVIVSSSSSMNSALNEDQAALPFDVSFTTNTSEGAYVPVRDAVEEVGIRTDIFDEMYEFPIYETQLNYSQFADFAALTSDAQEKRMNAQLVDAIAVGDYNRILMLQGLQPINLPEDQFALNVASDLTKAAVEAKGSIEPIQIGDSVLTCSDMPLQQTSLWTSRNALQITLILPDDIASRLGDPWLDVLVANYAIDSTVGDQMMRQKENAISAYSVEVAPTQMAYPFRYALKSDIVYNNGAINASMTFVGLYLGLIFMVAGAAILALQMLSATTDDKPRYALLGELGVTSKQMDRAILKQVTVYFFLPLGLAAIHSVIGIYFMTESLIGFGGPSMITDALTMVLLILLVYGIYFVATYLSCRRIIRTRDTRRID